jgi:hypothetical protein
VLQVSSTPPDSLDVFSAREYDWVERTGVFNWLVEQYRRLQAALSGLEQSHPTAYYVLLGVMAVLLLAILVHFGYVLWHAFSPVARDATAGRPTAPLRDALWYLAQARRLVAEGRYVEALGHRFLALLLELDGRKALSFHASKTPAEYVEEARLDGEARGRFRLLVVSLYQHLFAGVPCTADQWASFDREAQELGGRVAAS